MRRFRAVAGLVAALACFTAAAAFAQDAQGGARGTNWEVLIGAGTLLLGLWGVSRAIHKDTLETRDKINTGDNGIRDKIDEAIKAIASDSDKAHATIGSNIDKLRGEMQEDRRAADARIDADRRAADSRIDRLLEVATGTAKDKPGP